MLVSQSIRAVLAQQQFQQRLEVVPHLGLIVHGTLQLLLPKPGRERFHLQPNVFVLAFGQSLFQQRSSTWVGPGIEFRHFQHQDFEPPVFLRQGDLLVGEFFERIPRLGRRGGAPHRIRFGRLRLGGAEQDREQDGGRQAPSEWWREQ